MIVLKRLLHKSPISQLFSKHVAFPQECLQDRFGLRFCVFEEADPVVQCPIEVVGLVATLVI